MGPGATFSGIKEKKIDSSTLVYTHLVTRLHSSTPIQSLVYIRLVTRLHSSSDSTTFVYICLVTRLHSSTFVCNSSTFVYTCLVTRLCFQNRSLKTSETPRFSDVSRGIEMEEVFLIFFAALHTNVVLMYLLLDFNYGHI